MRFKVNHPPLKAPCFLIASMPYCEHVGVYLHEAPVSGEIKYWYSFINPIKIAPTTPLKNAAMVFIG
jgi:hypothetical protein